MKTKLAPLTLLIPAVVLAQPAPQTPVPRAPQAGTMQNPQVNPTNAANALKNAKDQSNELKSKLPSNGEYGYMPTSTTSLE
jgi:hypothetical protein